MWKLKYATTGVKIVFFACVIVLIGSFALGIFLLLAALGLV